MQISSEYREFRVWAARYFQVCLFTGWTWEVCGLGGVWGGKGIFQFNIGDEGSPTHGLTSQPPGRAFSMYWRPDIRQANAGTSLYPAPGGGWGPKYKTAAWEPWPLCSEYLAPFTPPLDSAPVDLVLIAAMQTKI